MNSTEMIQRILLADMYFKFNEIYSEHHESRDTFMKNLAEELDNWKNDNKEKK